MCNRLALAVSWIVIILTTPLLAQDRPDGERVYKEHCARCHEEALPRMPTRDMLRERSLEDIEGAFSFLMRRQAAELNSAERRAVSEYLSESPAGSSTSVR